MRALQRQRPVLLGSGQQKLPGRAKRRYLKRTLRSAKDEISDFDLLKLDDKYYEEVGITPEAAREELELLYGTDPELDDEEDMETYELGTEDAELNKEDRAALEDLEAALGQSPSDQKGNGEDAADLSPFGPPAVLIAGFREHELGMVRASIDSIGGHQIKVVPCGGLLLHSRLSEAIATEEPDWGKPRDTSLWRSAWGSQRTVLFAGLRHEEMLTLVDILEGGGLPSLVVAVATADNQQALLGEVLADAVKAQRHWKPKEFLSGMISSEDLINSPSQSGTSSSSWNSQPSPQMKASARQERGEKLATHEAQLADRTPVNSRDKDSRLHSNLQQESGTRPQRLPFQSSHEQHTAKQPLEPVRSACAWSWPSKGTHKHPSSRAASAQAPDAAPAKDIPAHSAPNLGTSGSPNARPKVGVAPPSTMPSNFSVNPGQSDSSTATQDDSGDVDEGLSAFAKIESSEFAGQQRALRQEAVEEIARRANASRASTSTAPSMQADNMIDAAASGEDLSIILGPNGNAPKDPEALAAARREEARKKMTEMLHEMRSRASDLPEEKRQKYNADLKALEDDQESISKVLSDLGADLDSIPKDDGIAVKKQLREEAWQPTRDAIGAALACGIGGDEIRSMVEEAEKLKAAGRGGWYPSVTTPKE